MSNEVVTIKDQLPEVPQATSLLAAIARAAENPAMDMDKMERMFAMHQAMLKTQAETAFNGALAQAQAEMTTVVKNKQNEFTRSRYADLDAIINWISPVYTQHGFSISFNTAECPAAGSLRIVAILAHSGGYSREYHLDVPLDDSGSGGKVNKTKTQAIGSTNSYARRYLICMIFNVTTADDNDGNNNPKAGIAAALTPAQRESVQKVASKMLAHLAAEEVADAVTLGEGSEFDAEEQIFLFTFFNAGQRKSLKTVSAQLRKTQLITDTKKKAIEAKIGKLQLNRDAVKMYCVVEFNKQHFSELTMDEYYKLAIELDNMAAKEPAAQKVLTAEMSAAPSQEDAGQGEFSDAAGPTEFLTEEQAIKNIGNAIDAETLTLASELARTAVKTAPGKLSASAAYRKRLAELRVAS